jgi:hypothetical protein
MLIDRPRTLSEEEVAEIEAHLEKHKEQSFEALKDLLGTIEDEEMGQFVYDIAFRPNDALPKRTYRPKMDIGIFVDQLYAHFDTETPHDTALLQFVYTVHEYYDILDDVVDGDVAPGHEREVVLASQAMLPLMVRLVHSLGDDAVEYWTRGAMRLTSSPTMEDDVAPSPEAYLDLLDRQAELYGFLTGLAPIVAGNPDKCDDAKKIGKAMFKQEQLALDCEQYEKEPDDPWNARALFSQEEILSLLSEWHDDVCELTESVSDPHASRIRALTALDTEAWADETF